MIEDKLQLDWSPEQISGWMGKNQAVCVSHEWIYQYILMDKLRGVICTNIYAVKRSVANVMEALIGAVNCRTG